MADAFSKAWTIIKAPKCDCGCAEGKCRCPPGCDCGCNHKEGRRNLKKAPRMVLDGMENEEKLCPCGNGKKASECCENENKLAAGCS